MKNIFRGLLLLSIVLIVSGCFKRDDFEGVKIYTTTYPIEYIANTLYGYNSEVVSIYPDGVNVYEYELTEKQIKEYSKAPLFIYNGLSEEKQIAKSFINTNRSLRIIDVSYGLKTTAYPESLWLSPSTYLMLATTVKNNLQDVITNKYINEEIDKNYEPLQETLSLLDAEIRSIANAAKEKGTNVIVTNSNAFNYLIGYGFEVISLIEAENVTENNLSALRSDFRAGDYTHVFMLDSEADSELIGELITSYKLTEVIVKSMNTLSEEERQNKETYLTIMKEYVENLRQVTLGQ